MLSAESMGTHSHVENIQLADSSPQQVRGPMHISAVVVDASCYSLPYDSSLCNALVKWECDVTLARSDYVHAKWIHSDDYRVWDGFYKVSHWLAKAGWHNRAWRFFKAAEHAVSMENFLAELRRKGPDIIHFEWLPLPMLDALYLRRMKRIAPLVLTLHNTTLERDKAASPLQRVGFLPALKHFNAIIVHSEFSRKNVIEQGWVAPELVHVIPHGVLDYYRSLPTVAPFPRRTDTHTLLFFGRIEPYKGVDILIEALAKLPAGIKEKTRLVIAGQARTGTVELQQTAKSLGVSENITWETRFLPEEDLPHLFRDADVVVLPYREIDQSGVLMTALAFDKPVVVSRVGGIPETIQDGIHGILVEPGNVAELAAALENLLCNPERRRVMVHALKSLRRDVLCWDKIAGQTLELYRKVAIQNELDNQGV